MEAMEMEERCRACREHAKHIYWHHKTVRFSWKMSGNSFRKLRIPKTFIQNFKGQLFEIVTLRGPSGNTWDVELKETEDNMLFENGWKEFVEDHSLAESDLLIFTYSGDSLFDLLIFDRDGVEKVYSYFIKKCKDKNTRCHQVKKKAKEFAATSHAPPSISEGNTVSEEHESEYEVKPQIKKDIQYVLKTRGKRKYLMTRKSSNPDRENIEHGPSKKFCDVQHRKVVAPPDGWKTYPLHFVSNRRPVTEEEKDRALQLALSFRTANPSFTAIMQPTHVSRRFSMNLPNQFVRNHLPKSSQMVEVRNKAGVTWHIFYENREKGSSALSKGWQKFVLENNLEVDDACTFEFSWEGEQIVIHVHIFRVVEPAVPLTRLQRTKNAGKQSRKAR